MSLRILLLNDCLPPDSDGGQELSALQIGRALQEAGHQVTFVCSEWRNSYNGDRIEDPSIFRILRYADVRPKPDSRLPKLESFLAVNRKLNVGKPNREILRRFIEQNGPFDVGFAFGVLRIGLSTVRAFTDCCVPLVWSISDVAIPVHFGMPNETKLYKAVFSTTGRAAYNEEKAVDFSHMLFVSEFVREEMGKAGIHPERWAIIPRAVNFEPVQLGNIRKDSPPTILVAARITHSRGIHVLIEAANLLAKKTPELEWRLKIAGDGPADYVADVKGLAAPLGNRVIFLGKLSNERVLDEMRRATIVVNPTVEVEGFSRANLEALASGVALVGSDIASYRELIGDSGCALTFETSSASALAEILERMLADPSERTRLAELGIARIREKYMMPSMVQTITEQLQISARNKSAKGNLPVF